MKILQISTYDIKGGAARAAYRLQRGLREMGHDCRMAVRYKDTNDDSVLRIQPKLRSQKDDWGFFLDAVIQGHYIDSHRTAVSNTLFSLPYPGYDLSRLSLVREADVINLHWVARYQSPLTLKRLFDLGKPVIWTLHDQWPFTGGCHYSAGCENYRGDCDGCPQLSDDPFDLPAAILKDKRRCFQDGRLTLVSPSRWLAECARKSRLFRSFRVEMIPNSVETDIFTPQQKEDAKGRMGLPAEAITILFGAESSAEKRKGFHELMAAMRYCQQESWFSELITADKVKLLCFGRAGKELGEIEIPLISLDYLDSDDKVVDAYRAADIFIQPSIEDNLPNTMLEAMSCGTPVVAFDVGGMPDVILDGVTGRLSPLGDIPGMAKAILSLIADPDELKAMQQHCRDLIEERFALSVQAKRYAALYAELAHESGASASCCIERGGDISWKSSVIEKETFTVPVVARVGRNTKSILDPILLKGLKACAPILQKKLVRCEADRDEGFKAVHEYQDQLKEVRFHLKMSEEDRAARLECIHEHENQRERIWNQLESSEAEKKRILDEKDHCQTELQRLQESLQKSNADNEAVQEVVRSRERELDACNERLEEVRACLRDNEMERKAHLLSIAQYHKQLSDVYEDLQTCEVDKPFLIETLNHAQRHFHEIGHLLHESKFERRSGLNRSPIDLYYTALNRTYLSALHALKFLGRDHGRGDAFRPTAINSPLVEAFISARSQKGALDDGALEFLYDMGQTLRKAICIQPSHLNIKSLYVLKQAGVDVSCFAGEGEPAERLKSLGIAQITEDLASWLIQGGQTAFAGYDAIMMDAEIDEGVLSLMKGRLWPRNRIIITGFGSNSKPYKGLCSAQAEMIFGIEILDQPPADWLDPFYKNRSLYLQMAWPWKEGSGQFPPTLPSGRPWPRISIVTATRNQGDYLEETLRSVLMQGYPNLEYIVIDGESTDTTPAVLERYRGQLTHCISEKDKGQSDALNKGFRLATGEILAWLNSDDRYLPWTLMRVALAFDIYDADMVAGGCALVKGNGKEAFRVHHTALAMGQKIPLPLERLMDIDGSWQKGDFFFQPEVFWARRVWEISGGKVGEDLFYSMDYELWVRMAQRGATIVHVPDTLALFRIHEKQKTNGVELPFLNELRQVNAALKAGRR